MTETIHRVVHCAPDCSFLRRFMFCAFGCIASTLLSPSGLSAADSQDPASGAAAPGRRVTLTRTVEPSFHIEPIVHRFEARRGAVIPFQFLIKSTGKSMEVTVSSVNLRQQETGLVMHDSESPPPDAIKFNSPTEFSLAPGESHIIDGTVTVPLAKSNFLSYGLLVRDNGMVTGEEVDKSDPTKTTASVRFVTQYVLRIDVETGVKDLKEMSRLVFEQGTVRSEKGMPVARTMLTNPTDFAFEFSVRGEIESAGGAKPTPFRFSMPSRATLKTDERYLVRVLPKSRIRLDAPVDGLLFPGRQNLRLAITNGRRAVVEESFPIRVAGGDYPALETKLAYLDQALSVEPAQIEVGQAEEKKRTCNLRFVNTSQEPKTVAIDVRGLDGTTMQGIRLSSDSFEVKPGRSKTIRASLQTSRKDQSVRFGEVHVRVDGQETTTPLPLALVNGKAPEPMVELGELQSLEQNGVTSFRLAVTNKGEGFVPIHADLRVADTKGRAFDLADGYGRWLRPHETRELAFIPDTVFEAGDYQLSLSFKTTKDQPPVERTLVITLDPGSSETE